MRPSVELAGGGGDGLENTRLKVTYCLRLNLVSIHTTSVLAVSGLVGAS